jgi:2'-5' RNA ligase
LRAFLALELNDEKDRERITEVQKELQSSKADLNLVNPQIIHFTLRFFGEISEQEADRVRERISTVRQEPFSVKLEGVGVFPSPSHISVVWAGVSKETSASLESLALKVNSLVSDVGEREDRSFKPHLTIARVKTGRNKQSLLEALSRVQRTEFGECRFNNLKLKRSSLTPKGPVYDDVFVFNFTRGSSSSLSSIPTSDSTRIQE